MMRYKGYRAGPIHFDEEHRVSHGEVQDLRDVVTFQGRDADELLQALHDSVDDYLDFCRSRGVPPDRSYSGKMMIRTEPDLHRRIAYEAAERGMSVKWVTSTLRQILGTR